MVCRLDYVCCKFQSSADSSKSDEVERGLPELGQCTSLCMLDNRRSVSLPISDCVNYHRDYCFLHLFNDYWLTMCCAHIRIIILILCTPELVSE